MLFNTHILFAAGTFVQRLQKIGLFQKVPEMGHFTSIGASLQANKQTNKQTNKHTHTQRLTALFPGLPR